MARKLSAGTLLWRRDAGGQLAVLLVHPSGRYNRHAAWSLPKGEVDEGEDLERAARRETLEETGVVPGALVDLGHVDYRKSAKRVHAFAGAMPADAAPRPSSWEVDRAELVPLDLAPAILHPDQQIFLTRLVAWLAAQEPPGGAAGA